MTIAGAVTYRLQLNRGFTFFDTIDICDYLHDLGITHLYLSPVFESMTDSVHGYDMTDFAKISRERGGQNGLRALDQKLRSYDPPMGMIVDFVPNHMAAHSDNPYWADVLAKGRDSEWWPLFDFKLDSGEKLRLPVLGSSLQEAVQSGALKEDIRDNKPVLVYGDHWFPLRPENTALADQHYELVYWKEIFRHVSYRRFFDITSLVCLRMEDPLVFAAVHKKLFSLIKELPSITGVRIDHVDGLYDPAAYLKKLSQHVPRIWVEKILGHDENLPEDWPVKGTTGYEFISRLNNLFVEKEDFSTIEQFWQSKIQPAWKSFGECVIASKKQALDELFPAELQRLGDFTKGREYWRERTATLDVYRRYETGDRVTAEWQQLSGPAMAKGLEDTAHYRYTPLTALNEVGCEGEILEGGPAAFFTWLQERGREWSGTMNTTSTHDTKRSEDTRARLYALADRPEAWIAFYKSLPQTALDQPTAYFLYQTLAAVWPLDGRIDAVFKERIAAYMQKAAREARLQTNWLAPHTAYEETLRHEIFRLLAEPGFVKTMNGFVRDLAWAGCLYSLSALTLKIWAPCLADFYQGSELWDFSLVDPDNRRAVDYRQRRLILQELDDLEQRQGRPALLRRLTGQWQDGAIKLWLMKKLVALRKSYSICEALPSFHPFSSEGYLCFSLAQPNYAWKKIFIGLPLKTSLDGPLEDPPELKDFFTDKIVTARDWQNPRHLFDEFPLVAGTFSAS